MFVFKDQVAFVTGGASGIGYGIACQLARQGAKIALADIDDEQMKIALKDFPGEAIGVHLNVTDRDNWAKAKEETEKKLGPVSILINCAGIMDNPLIPPDKKGLCDYSFAQWDRMIGINLTGNFNGVLTFAPGMRQRRFGHIVNTASVQGIIPTAGEGAYSASKSGVVAMSEALRDELAPFDVGVSVLCPGVVASRLAINAAKQAGIKVSDALKMPGLQPVVVGDVVIKAIKDNKLYIFTHAEYKKFAEERFAHLIDGFLDVPVSADYDPNKPLPGTREWANDPKSFGKI